MQISLTWVNELIDIKSISLDSLIDKLTLGGFEIEDVIELTINKKKQMALEISSTANRSDSLSIQGISAEIRTLFNKKTNFFNYRTKFFDWKQKIETKNQIPLKRFECSQFITLTVENLNIINIPKWIKNKLSSSGLTPTGTLLDFQNYILLETGYPLITYDLEKIYTELNTNKFKVKIENSTNFTNFSGINGVNYNLDESILVTKANNLPISIAGIIESQNICCSEKTNNLLIEGSIFNAAKIRQQSRKLSLRTERSARYEKSLKGTYLIEALYRLVNLLKISNPDLYCKFHSAGTKPESIIEPIFLRYKTVKEILGPIKVDKNYISIKLIHSYLNRLKFKFTFNNLNSTWKVIVPTLRSDDIVHEIDLIEEIGRLHGFNNFLVLLPKIQNIGSKDQSYQIRKKITSCLLNLGLNELNHYSLMNSKTFINNNVKLINPLLTDYSALRSSLLPNLILTVHENLKQSNLILEGFEYGHIFSQKDQKIINEIENVAGIFGGSSKKCNWSEKSKFLSWFEAKGKIEYLFQQLNLQTEWLPNFSLNKILHPYRSATICFKDKTILGIFGQIHPSLAKKLILSSEIYLFEFSTKKIQNQIYQTPLTIYKEYSIYPKIIKDLSFIIKQNISFSEIQNIIYWNGTKFLSQIILADDYKGETIPQNYRSLCLQLVFQSKNKTLKNKDVEIIIKNLEFVLRQKFDITSRV